MPEVVPKSDAPIPAEAPHTAAPMVAATGGMAAVRIQSTIAQPAVVAGEPFTISTRITNLHDEPIHVFELRYDVPFQIQWIADKDFDEHYVEVRRMPFLKRLFARSNWHVAAQPPGQSMSFKSTDPASPIETIAPGQSMIYTFKALAARWLFASNGRVNFDGRVRYATSRGEQSSIFEISFPIRPPLRANVIGAVLGAVTGAAAERLRERGGEIFLVAGVEELAAVVLAAILSVIAVVYASRRGGEGQPILTIEDFWGGLIVGFLMGYLGHSFFFEVVPVARPDGA